MKKLLLPLLAVVCLVDDTSTRAITATTTTATTASQLGNISTRGLVQTGANVMIGGFIIQGTVAKTVIVRAIGPSLTQYGVPGALVDPTLELHDSTGVIATNDNWQTTQIGGIITADQVSAIQNSGKAPSNATESAIIATLQPGNYTAIVGGKNNTTGVALVEVYDLSSGTTSILGNISTRGLVQTGANVMIGGFIIQGTSPETVIVRAIGPSLTQYGVPGALVDPTLELHDSTGVIATNDNWQTTQIGGIITADQVSAIQNSGKAPSNATESAIIATLQPGNYTVIVGGKNNTTGVALVEVYDLGPTIDLLAGSTNFTGPYPIPATVTYTDNGQSKSVLAYPGQIIVFFNVPVNDSNAKTLISSDGGTVLGEIPVVGYYLVHVPVGSEASFINAIKTDSRVNRALPDPVGIRGCTNPGANILEGCGDTHDSEVEATIQADGGSVRGCSFINDDNNNISADMVYNKIVAEGNIGGYLKSGTLINLSSYGASLNGVLWDGLTTAQQKQLMDEWYNFMSVVLDAIAALPPGYRDDLVVTLCAGNNHMPITNLMSALRINPAYAAILQNNVLVVGTDLNAFSNFSFTDPDVAVMNNPNGQFGTSFAAPGAMAVIQQIMNQTCASAKVALQAAKQAVAKNASHQLVLSEAVFTLNITNTGTGTGTVTATTSAATPNELGPKYTIGAVVTLTAVPDSGSTFVGWSGDASGTGTATLTMTATKSVIATFNQADSSSLSLAITSQTWTPSYYNGSIVSYSAVVTGTASGPIQSAIDAISFDFGGATLVTSSWGPSTTPGDGNQNERRPGDPAATTWTVTESFAGLDEVLTIELGNANTIPSIIYVYAHP
jgi:hypothetical protein